MEPVKQVSAEEFAAHAAEYLAGAEPIAVEQDGRIVGRYEPTANGHAINGAEDDDLVLPPPPRDGPLSPGFHVDDETLRKLEERISPESLAIVRELDRTLQRIYEETGLTEDEFADLMDPGKPFPDDEDPVAWMVKRRGGADPNAAS